MRRVNILGVEISAVNKETAIQYLLENMDKARGKYICACNVHMENFYSNSRKTNSVINQSRWLPRS